MDDLSWIGPYTFASAKGEEVYFLPDGLGCHCPDCWEYGFNLMEGHCYICGFSPKNAAEIQQCGGNLAVGWSVNSEGNLVQPDGTEYKTTFTIREVV